MCSVRDHPIVGQSISFHRDPAEATNLPTVMTADEVAALLRVNRKSVYAAVIRGDLPGAHRVGRKLRFARDAVLAWLVDSRGAPRTP